MATEVNLPELGESVTEGTVTRWLKQEGDDVAVDEPLLEVSTDKVDTEIPSPVAGVLLEIRAHEDDTVEVGGALALIGSADEAGGGGGGDGGGRDEQAAEGSADQPAEVSADGSADEPAEQGQPPPTDGSEDTALDQEKNERDEAHEQAERADTPADDSGQDSRQDSGQDSAQHSGQQQDEAPREEVAAATASASDSGAGEGGGEQTVVRLPELGESVTEGTVTRWLKHQGDQVAVDESLLEVSTDKVDTEIPSPVAGTLLEIKVNEDETVEVGAELAVIGSGQSAAAAPAPEAPAPPQEAEAPTPTSAPEPAPAPEQPAAQEAPTESAP